MGLLATGTRIKLGTIPWLTVQVVLQRTCMTCLHMFVGSCSQHNVTVNIAGNNSMYIIQVQKTT